MPMQRWGTFAVKDHTDPAALVPEILLYDRLILPVPPPEARKDWEDKRWEPKLLDERLRQLGPLALRRPWGAERGPAFSARLNEIRIIEYNGLAQADVGEVLPYFVTREILAEEERRRAGPDVRVVAAFGSPAEFLQGARVQAVDREAAGAHLAILLAHEFASPDPGDNAEKALRKVIDLARDDDLPAKRRAFYRWQERHIGDIVAGHKRPEDVVPEMRDLLADYDRAVETALGKCRRRRAYTIASIGLAAVPVVMTAGHAALIATALGAAGVGTGIAQLVQLDWAPNVDPGDARPAAMFHEARKAMGRSRPRGRRPFT